VGIRGTGGRKGKGKEKKVYPVIGQTGSGYQGNRRQEGKREKEGGVRSRE